MTRTRVEILYFEGCPDHGRARALVERVAAELLEPVRDAIAWALRVAEDFGQTRAPMPGELAALRALKPKGKP